jgi:hypothetical protein
MALRWEPSRTGGEPRRVAGRGIRKARGRRAALGGTLERLEDRWVLAITSTTAIPITVTEGVAFSGGVLTFTSNDPLPQSAANYTATIAWGDGATTPATSITPAAGGGFQVNGSHTYAEEGTDTINVTIQDLVDATTGTGTSSATVAESGLNGTPVNITGPEGPPGFANVVVGNFNDPGSPDPATSFTATINWGDGTITPGTVGGAAGAYTVSGSHAYADEGTFHVITTFSETGVAGAIGTTTTLSMATVTEADAFTGGVVSLPAGAVEGAKVSGTVATFTDTGYPTNTLSDLSATINWGDGTTTPGTIIANGGAGAFAVQGSHTFVEEGSFPLSVTVTDDAPGTATATFTATVIVADAPLTASPKTVNGTEGRPLTNVDVATFTDADPLGTATDFLATIDWGDGTTTAGTIVEDTAGTFHVVGSHTYTEESATPYSIGVSIIDNGNGRAVNDPTNSKASTTSTANIAQSPLLAVASSVVATEGVAVPITTTVATFTDTGGADPVADYTAMIDWGDGSAPVAGTVALSGNGGNFVVTPSAPHTYDEEGTYAVTVRVTDSDAGNPNPVPTTVITTGSATVADAALTGSATQPVVNTTESPIFPTPVFGAPLFTGQVASFLDSNPFGPASQFTATIDWGDGTPQSAGTVSGGAGAYTVSGSHTYADSGVNGGTGHFPITVYIKDDGGSRVTVSNTANVADTAITVAGALNPASDSGESHFDAITNVSQPNLFGSTEPNAIVTLFAMPTGGGPLIMIGQTAASAGGFWSITSNRLADGSYTITAIATDQFGETTSGPVQILPNASQGPLVIDTVGPRITNVFFNRPNGQVDVVFQDDRSGLNQATLIDSANYKLTNPHTKPATFLVTNISVSPAASPTSPQQVRLVFNSGRPLRGGFYTFTVRDSTRGPSTIQDVAGNSLDGEFYGSFPSGNGIPGGDFVAMLDAIHNKIFAPQTVVGTASPSNGGQGGPPVGAPHSGHFTPVVPRGSQVVLTTKHRAAAVTTHHASPVGAAKVAPASHPRGPRVHH